MAFNIENYARRCDIGFRVEVHDPNHGLNNSTFRERDGSMDPRNANRIPDASACRDHLDLGSMQPGPFISFFTKWDAALQRRQWFLDRGATNVVIIAVWLRGLTRVYDAYNISGANEVDMTGDRGAYLFEVLLWGGISADSYRILAIFDGVGQTRDASLSLEPLQMTVKIPPGFLYGIEGRRPDATNRLREEVFLRTGTRDDDKFIRLALSIGSCTYLGGNDGPDKVIFHPFAGLSIYPFGGTAWRITPFVAG